MPESSLQNEGSRAGGGLLSVVGKFIGRGAQVCFIMRLLFPLFYEGEGKVQNERSMFCKLEES